MFLILLFLGLRLCVVFSLSLVHFC